MVEPRLEAREVAAEELDRARSRPSDGALVPGTSSGGLARDRSTRRRATSLAGSPFANRSGKDLVEDPVREPRRRVEPGDQPEVVAVGRGRTDGGRDPFSHQVPVRPDDQEPVVGRRHRQPDRRPPTSGRPAPARPRPARSNACSPSGVVRRNIAVDRRVEARLARAAGPRRRSAAGRGRCHRPAATYRTEPSWWTEARGSSAVRHRAPGQPLTAPEVRPPTMYAGGSRTGRTVGIAVSSVPAANIPKFAFRSPATRPYRPTARVLRLALGQEHAGHQELVDRPDERRAARRPPGSAPPAAG